MPRCRRGTRLVSSSGLVRETATPTIPRTGVQLGADLFPESWTGLTLFYSVCFGERVCDAFGGLRAVAFAFFQFRLTLAHMFTQSFPIKRRPPSIETKLPTRSEIKRPFPIPYSSRSFFQPCIVPGQIKKTAPCTLPNGACNAKGVRDHLATYLTPCLQRFPIRPIPLYAIPP